MPDAAQTEEMNHFLRSHKAFLFILMSLLAFMVASPAFSQKWEQVRSSSEYLCGEGYGNSIDEADQQALSDLISKISLNVSASKQGEDKSAVRNGQVDESSQFSMTVQTYSQATLTNTERVILHNEPDAHVGRWIKKSELNRIFAGRIAKIKDMVGAALKAETKGKADDALRNYYWALTLLKSLQYPNEVMFTDDEGKEHCLFTWIPERMGGVFDDLHASVAKREGDNIDLFITYRGKAVNSVDYTYFDGSSWSNIYSAKDGRGVLEMAPGSQPQNLQLKYEFEYRSQAKIDPELESVLTIVKSTAMRKAYSNVSMGGKMTVVTEDMARASFSSNTNASAGAPRQVSDGAAYMIIVDKVVQAIKNKNHSSVRSLFTDEGWDIYTRLINYGSARIVGTPSCSFVQTGDYVTGRSVQMAFSFKTGGRKSFVEDVSFTFDSNKKISSLAFGLGNTAVDDILNKGAWNENTRAALMAFLENYKTAYALKRREYIRNLFDDDAVIIVGNVLRKAPQQLTKDMGGVQIGNADVTRRNRYTKDQYLSNLNRCFDNNEFINIRFADNDVRKMGKGGELYAIQISQDYYSSTYGDKGYLFLMVDINDPANPIIKVRTWQPEKDPNFGLYSAADFF